MQNALIANHGNTIPLDLTLLFKYLHPVEVEWNSKMRVRRRRRRRRMMQRISLRFRIDRIKLVFLTPLS
jgi:hypothetical protein